MDTREKKFYVPELRHYNNNLSQRWRIEWWEPTHNGSFCRRVVKYGDINKGSSIEERTKLANAFISRLNFNVAPRKKNIIEKVLELGAMEWRSKTLSAYKTVSEEYRKFLDTRSAQSATEQTINEFLLHLHKNGTKNNTLAKYRNTLHTLYNKAIIAKLTDFNPVRKVPSIKRRPQSLFFFSDKQIAAFKKAAIDKQLWLAIEFLFYCFIRPGEMRLLKISAINFEYGFIEIPGEISKNRKTEKVSIPSHFIKSIKYLQEYPSENYILSKNGTPGEIPISTKWLNNNHRLILKELKITGRYAFYSWKHTGVVKAVKAGINIKDLQLQLRHHSLDMVNEYLKNLGVLDSEDLKVKFPKL